MIKEKRGRREKRRRREGFCCSPLIESSFDLHVGFSAVV